MIRVSAGIVRRADGRMLICQRGEGRNNAHLWEFPGGKQEAGETPEACLIRELMEELSLPIRNVQLLCQREEGGILFDFLTAETDSEPTLTEHEAFAFVQPWELTHYSFCPADTGVARELSLPDTFLWDLDGTLMDTYPGMVEAFCKAMAVMGIDVAPERVLDLMKVKLGHCCRIIAEENGLTKQQVMDAFQAEEILLAPEKTWPLPGIPEALQALKTQGCRHFVATHRERRTALPHLTHAELMALFDGGVYGDDGFPSKPAPDMLLHLIREHRLDPARCVMIGDRPLDIGAGRAAGMRTCLIDTENRFPDTPCDLRVNTAQGLAALLRPGEC